MDSASYRYSRVWFENVIFPTSTLPVFKKRASYASCSLSLISTWFLFLCKVSPVRNVSSASIRNPHCRTSGLVSISIITLELYPFLEFRLYAHSTGNGAYVMLTSGREGGLDATAASVYSLYARSVDNVKVTGAVNITN